VGVGNPWQNRLGSTLTPGGGYVGRLVMRRVAFYDTLAQGDELL